jgi:hypothetical protein
LLQLSNLALRVLTLFGRISDKVALFQRMGISLLRQLVDGLNMSFALLMMMKDTFIHEGLIASNAVELACSLILIKVTSLSLPIHPQNGRLPPKKTSLLPLAFEHLNNLVVDLSFKVDHRLHTLKEVAEIVPEFSQVQLVLVLLFEVERHDLEFVKVLKPAQIIVRFDQVQLAKLFEVAKRHVMLM